MPSIAQMRYAVSVANLNSFQKAANACHVTQPTLSMQVQKIESELEIILFDRTKKPVVVTDRGALFIEKFQNVLTQIGLIQEMARMDHLELIGNFKVGIIPTISPILSPVLIKYFQIKHPKLEFQLLEKTTDEIIYDLKSEKIDCGILSTPLLEKNITETPLYQERLVVFHHSSVNTSKSPRLMDFSKNELILLSDQNCLRQQTTGLCSLHASNIIENHHKKFEAQSITSLLEMVRNIPSYCLIPESFIPLLSKQEKSSQVKTLKDSGAFREIGIIRYRNQLKNRPFQELEKCIKNFSVKKDFSIQTKKPLSPVLN